MLVEDQREKITDRIQIITRHVTSCGHVLDQYSAAPCGVNWLHTPVSRVVGTDRSKLESRQYSVTSIAAGPLRPRAGSASRGMRRKLGRPREYHGILRVEVGLPWHQGGRQVVHEA